MAERRQSGSTSMILIRWGREGLHKHRWPSQRTNQFSKCKSNRLWPCHRQAAPERNPLVLEVLREPRSRRSRRSGASRRKHPPAGAGQSRGGLCQGRIRRTRTSLGPAVMALWSPRKKDHLQGHSPSTGTSSKAAGYRSCRSAQQVQWIHHPGG